jgi:hypothetical protein
MLKRFFADYHGCGLWGEQFTPEEWRIWISRPVANTEGPYAGSTIHTAPIDKYRTEADAKLGVTTWARRTYLQNLNPADEPEWKSEWPG